MGMDGSGLSVADALALQRDNCDDGMFGGNGSWVFFLFFLLAWGGGGFFGNNRGVEQVATSADVQRGFDNQNVMNKLNGLENGLCDGFYAQNTTMLNGFNGVQRDLCSGFAGVNAAINQSRFDAQQCCCETNRNIDSAKFQLSQCCCDIMQNNDRNTQRIIDHMTQSEVQTLRDQLQTANFQLSQQAQSANIIGQLRPTPTPAYLTCSPYESNIYASRGFYGNGWFNNGCCNNGCGCC